MSEKRSYDSAWFSMFTALEALGYKPGGLSRHHSRPCEDGADAGAIGVLTFEDEEARKFYARLFPGPHPEEETWRKEREDTDDAIREQRYQECTWGPGLSEEEFKKQSDDWYKKPWPERKEIIDTYTKAHPFWEWECEVRLKALRRLRKWLEEAEVVKPLTTEQRIKAFSEAEGRALKKHGII